MRAYLNKRIVVSSGLFLLALGLRVYQGVHPLMLLVVLYSGLPILVQSLKNLKFRIIGIDLLVSIAVIGAVFLGEYWEAAAVSYLFYLGTFLELMALAKTRGTIRGLIESVPNKVVVLVEGREREVDIEAVELHDQIVIKPGFMIPVDGVVEAGFASVNQASITGESMPVEKENGDAVFAGTMIESGHLIVSASKIGSDTVYAGIVRLIEDAQDRKTETQKMIDGFAQYYTPLVIGLALVTYWFTMDIRVALSLLVVSCPGALVIATPISIVSGIGAAARSHVLIKSGRVLEELAKVDCFAFDKTGTLTLGKPQVDAVIELSKTREEILWLAAIGERYSEHPIAEAIVAAVDRVDEFGTDYEMVPGKGVVFTYGGKRMFLGNHRLFEGRDLPNYDKERIVVIIGDEDEIYGVILLKDGLRPGISKTLESLKGDTVMITGDHDGVAKDVASRLGIVDVYANVLPQDKSRIVEQLMLHKRVAMVGDGINDAPALAIADVGISIGGASNTVAMETSDIIIMNGRVETLPFAVGVAQATRQIMRQNLVIAVLTALILIVGVLNSQVSLSVGMFVHEASVLLVILNSFRLLARKDSSDDV